MNYNCKLYYQKKKTYDRVSMVPNPVILRSLVVVFLLQIELDSSDG